MPKEKQIQLKVVEALQDDAYKGIARIDSEVMRDLNIRRGDIIVIKGNRETVAIADRAYPADMGEGIIRIDGILRKNSKTGIGDVVTITKADVKEAKKVVIAPAQKGIMVQADSDGLRRGLLGRAVLKGDIVVLGGVQRRRDLMSEEFGDMDDVFGNLGDILGGMGFGNMGGGVTQIKFMIISANPNQPVIITENTEVSLSPKAVELSDEKIPEITYEDIGGLTDEIKKIRELVEIPLKHPEIFERLGIEPPKGILLHGPPGTGKTLLAKAVANESEANFILLNGPEIMSKFYGESEKKIRDIFEEAEKTAPAIIFIDEIDAIAPKREEVQGEVERRVVSQLLTMMDGLKSRGKVIVIGATNRPNAIDSALRRPGRFDRELEISVPGKEGRLQVLKIHTRNMPMDKKVNLDEIASITHGFVGADLESLTKEAAIIVLRKILPQMKLDGEEKIPQEILEKLIVSHDDFVDALKTVRPSAMREVLVETPNIEWNSVGGLDSIKQELKEAVEWPMKYSDSFERLGIRPSRGILLYGPPGTGKTLLAKAVAKESEANFIQVKGPSLLSMWVGKSEEGMRKIFERARQVAPCVIFFDEIDSLAGRRGMETGTKVTERVLNQMLAEMDGLEDLNDVIVIGATNRPDMLDTALLRPGRFDKILLVNAPEDDGRLEVLKIHTKKMPLAKDVDLKYIAKETSGYTGADLEAVAREAAYFALRKDINSKEVKKEHFEEALKKVKPSVTKSTIDLYKRIEETYLKSAKAAIPMDNSYLG
ncbi:MAG: CDC48 family AAA ATPase [Candidatus Nanoarchaeia archaeon]|nr:CDC48 family AAA ATPase [Candidatus Nanoarchaeia archaeon]MDD5357942.1 CDC48 family AAA ATPase [Candidatus Nanoarchaeia archaeon]MDD5588861.1 CDC48 family AAA ATPase [Candidatus Nanoarchaeia archaeon]